MTIKTQESIDLIFKHTHEEFKGIERGEKYIRCCPTYLYGPIKALPDDVFAIELEKAERREICEKRDEMLQPIMAKYNLSDIFESTKRSRDDIDSLLDFVSLGGALTNLEELRTDIVTANVVFPS